MTMGEVRGKSEPQKARGPSVLEALPMAAYMLKSNNKMMGDMN